MIDLKKKVGMTDIVNSTLFSPREAAKECAKDHRYLQEQLFIFCVHYLDEMSENYHKKNYDARNEFSTYAASRIIDSIFDREDMVEIKYSTMLKESKERKKNVEANAATN